MSAWKDLDLRWKALVYLAVTLIPAISGGTWLILNNMYWLEVKNSVSGLMNFVDAKQQGVIRFLGQNEKFAKELVVLVDKAPAGSVGDYFRAVVETDVFKEEEHPFKAEIRAGKRKIPTWQVYRAIDYVEDGVVKVSSDPARVGLSLSSEPDARVGYSDVHMHNGVPEIAFRAKSANGEVIVHADARVLTNIVNGEIGNLEGDMGAFYLAGVGKTFDYYMTNTDNVLITESRVHPDALLRLKGSDFPWQRTLHGANDPACKNGVYETDARVMTGCREAMGFYESQDGKLMLGVSMPFYDSNWTIVVEQEADEILGPLFSLRNRIIVATVVVLSLIVALSYVVLKRLMGRIDRVGGVVAAVAGGDLSVPEIPIDSRDEIGRIAENVNRMLNNLRSLVSNIRSSSGSVDNAATRLAAVTEETTHGVVQQQQEIEQVATAMNEMSATVQEVARNAMEAAESANATAGQTAEGNRIVSQTMDAINALANEIDNATDVIHELEAESNNIGTILDVIRGIAEQTNLLALNAAIEAARAGEQGRGFAVVADEVRTLAGRTQESTREIQEKIERLQAGTVQAVAAMQNSSQQAEASVQHAASAKESLDAITSSIDTINGRNTQIATAAEEQSHVAEEINKNVTNISQVAERNANGAQQVADSSDELTGLSHELQGMVKRFRL